MSVHTIIEYLPGGCRVLFVRQFVHIFSTVKTCVCLYKVKTANT